MRLPKQFTWDWFTHQAHRRWPKSPPPPSRGCWREATLWLRENRHLLEARGLLKHATGDRARALSYAARESLILGSQAKGA